MICAHCRERDHEDCPGGTWCDCQHLPSAGHAQDAGHTQGQEQAAEQVAEPPVNWVRQG